MTAMTPERLAEIKAHARHAFGHTEAVVLELVAALEQAWRQQEVDGE